MTPPCVLVLFAVPGREQLTWKTLRLLDDRGGPFTGPRFVVWSAPQDQPPIGMPQEHWWPLHLRQLQQMGGAAELWRTLEAFRGHDVVFFEDDVVPCLNVLPYLERWETPPEAAFTTFFNGQRVPEGVHMPGADATPYFWFSQCLKLPARFVDQVVAGGPPQNRSQDVALGLAARRLGLGIYYHRSLVQHVGAESIGQPGAKLEGIREPASDFVGETHNAIPTMQLP